MEITLPPPHLDASHRAQSDHATAETRSEPFGDPDGADVEALGRAEHRGLRGIMARHQRAVMATCLSHLRDADLATEMVQEVFLTLWRERATYQHRGRLRAYLLEVARLRCLATVKRSRARQRLRHALHQQPRPPDHDPLEDDVFRAQCHRRVIEALETLVPEQAEVVALRSGEGLPLTEIGARLDLSVGTVKSRLHRGLKALRQAMPGSWDHEGDADER